jgi:hypothetical protein
MNDDQVWPGGLGGTQQQRKGNDDGVHAEIMGVLTGESKGTRPEPKSPMAIGLTKS